MTETDILCAICGCLLFAFAMAIAAFLWLTRPSRVQRLLGSDVEEPVRPDGYGLALGWKRYKPGWTKKLW